MPYLGIFGLEFEKAFVISEISNLEFLKNESWTHAVNFGIGSAFSKGPGSCFSEDPVPGPGQLYNVCPMYPRSFKNNTQKIPICFENKYLA